MIRERERSGVSGWVALAILVPLLGLCVWGFVSAAKAKNPWMMVGTGVAGLAVITCLCGLFVVNPNEGRVLQLFGAYHGTIKLPGLRWANPLYTKRRLSLRVRNFESARLKVNDIEGNPIEIAAVVVWKVVDTAEASFEVDN